MFRAKTIEIALSTCQPSEPTLFVWSVCICRIAQRNAKIASCTVPYRDFGLGLRVIGDQSHHRQFSEQRETPCPQVGLVFKLEGNGPLARLYLVV